MHPKASSGTGWLAVLLALAACASGPKIRTDHDPSADFRAYQTYGFVTEPGTDREGYSSLVTTHFKNAVNTEMQARGYRLVEQDPDLLVNFFTSMKDRTETRNEDVFLGTQLYRNRFGTYTAWPLYDRNVVTRTYEVGTASIDLVDAKRRQLVWEGVAEGRIEPDDRDNPAESIASAVRDMFRKFPVAAGATPR